MSLEGYAILCLVLIFAGAGLAAFFNQAKRRKIVQDIQSFSGAFLFGILILELFPAIFKTHNHSIGIFVLIGFFLQIGIDVLTGGVEHGHVHFHEYDHKKSMLLSLFIGLGVHAVFDGLPFVGFTAGTAHLHSVYTGILLHKIAEGFTLYLVMSLLGISQWRSIGLILVFAFLTPLGMYLIQQFPDVINNMTYVLAFAGGSLLHVAITILFESENLHHHGIAWRKLIWIITGIGLSVLIVSM